MFATKFEITKSNKNKEWIGGAAKARRLAKASHFLFGYFSSLKYEGMSKDTYFKIEERSWAWELGGLEAWKGIGEHRTCSPLLWTCCRDFAKIERREQRRYQL